MTALNCAVPIKNQEWCGDKGELGAKCFDTLTPDTRVLTKAQWDAERFGQVCTQAQNFVDNKKTIEKLCHMTKSCTYETQQAIAKFFDDVAAFQLELTNVPN